MLLLLILSIFVFFTIRYKILSLIDKVILSWIDISEPKFNDIEKNDKKITTKNSNFNFLSEFDDDTIFDILKTVIPIPDAFKFIIYKKYAKERNEEFTKLFFFLQLKSENEKDETKTVKEFEDFEKQIKVLQRYKDEYDSVSNDKSFLKYIEMKMKNEMDSDSVIFNEFKDWKNHKEQMSTNPRSLKKCPSKYSSSFKPVPPSFSNEL